MNDLYQKALLLKPAPVSLPIQLPKSSATPNAILKISKNICTNMTPVQLNSRTLYHTMYNTLLY